MNVVALVSFVLFIPLLVSALQYINSHCRRALVHSISHFNPSEQLIYLYSLPSVRCCHCIFVYITYTILGFIYNPVLFCNTMFDQPTRPNILLRIGGAGQYSFCTQVLSLCPCAVCSLFSPFYARLAESWPVEMEMENGVWGIESAIQVCSSSLLYCTLHVQLAQWINIVIDIISYHSD